MKYKEALEMIQKNNSCWVKCFKDLKFLVS